VCNDAAFAPGGITTAYLKSFEYSRRAIEVIDPGAQTTVQDYPGRLGYWRVGVPPSGPMDSLAFRTANRLVGNPQSAAGLEITISGPSLRFDCDAVIAITGAECHANVPQWAAVAVRAGEAVEIGSMQGRAYLVVAGGIDVPEYLGSKSTFLLGKFGGHAGRAL